MTAPTPPPSSSSPSYNYGLKMQAVKLRFGFFCISVQRSHSADLYHYCLFGGQHTCRRPHGPPPHTHTSHHRCIALPHTFSHSSVRGLLIYAWVVFKTFNAGVYIMLLKGFVDKLKMPQCYIILFESRLSVQTWGFMTDNQPTVYLTKWS